MDELDKVNINVAELSLYDPLCSCNFVVQIPHRALTYTLYLFCSVVLMPNLVLLGLNLTAVSSNDPEVLKLKKKYRKAEHVQRRVYIRLCMKMLSFLFVCAWAMPRILYLSCGIPLLSR